MLLATQSESVAGAAQYYESVLAQGDYYLGQEVAGQWRGKGSIILGLGQGASVTKDQFVALLKGYHPVAGTKLTQRIKKNRRPGTDLTFSVPKSVSLAWAVGRDERVIDALNKAVHETMCRDIEPLMERRVRSGRFAGTKHKANTGKLIYADFLHKTSRPVDGTPDPHLHIHAFVMNWTEEGGKHYAGEMEEIVRQRPSLQAKFDARLARELHRLGYGIEQVQYTQSGRLKRGWEIRGVERSTIEKFSRRTMQIEQHAKTHNVEDASRKGRLGRLTREKKDHESTVDELRKDWWRRLTPAEQKLFRNLEKQGSQTEEQAEAERTAKSVQYALDHYLYRQSAVERHQLVGAALEHGLTLHPEAVEKAIDAMPLIQREVDVNGAKRQFVTTRAVLESERDLIAFARDSRGVRKPIASKAHEFERSWLNEHQQAAVLYLLHSRDTVMAVVGGAGTGKTSLKQEAVGAIQQQGKRVFSFAPSTGAKEVLQRKGFESAETVEHLIRNTRLQEDLKNQVLWIDEAGLLDVRSMNAVFAIAKQQNSRVILSGDTRQHSSPRRGEAMRLLESEAGLQMSRVEKIQRQRGRYREAIAFVSRGHDVVDPRTGKTGLLAGFDLLDAMGKIKELDPKNRHAQLAETYLGAIEKGKSALVVAPTHAEAQAATAEIRSRLQTQGRLSCETQAFTQYRPLHLSEAEKGEARTYAQHEGEVVVQFHQNTRGGFNRGDRYRVVSASNGEVQLASVANGQRRVLPLDQTDRFEVYSQGRVDLAVGDQVRFSLGGKTKDGSHRISNGRLDEIQGFNKRGDLVLKNGWVVDKNFAHLDLGYVITSHASQGKDRDVAIAAMGSQSLGAINAKQFYVTASRGKEDVAVFVDSKAKVRRAIQRSGQQLSATEVVKAAAQSKDRPAQRRRDNSRERSTSLRDRIVRWWRDLRQQRSAGHAHVGRHRQAGVGLNLGGIGTPSPGLGRSRG